MIKAVIPVAGLGIRLRPHTHTQPKPLIPVAGKPILGHIIEGLLEAGVKDFVFVIGHLGEKIESFVKEKYAGLLHAEFVVQSPRIGLGHALYVARDSFRSADEVLIVLGDTIFNVDMKRFLESKHSAVGVQEVEDPRKFGVAVLDDEGFLLSAVEKPKIPKSNLALVGLYKIRETEALAKSLEELLAGPPSESGQYHLTDALRTLVERGTRIQAITVDSWYDCGKMETLLEANRILLQKRRDLPEPECENCIIIPPVYVAPGAKIQNSVVGPFVSVDEHAEIRNSIVRNTILGSFSNLDSITIENSVVGSDTSLKGRSYSVNIGDNTQIDFND